MRSRGQPRSECSGAAVVCTALHVWLPNCVQRFELSPALYSHSWCGRGRLLLKPRGLCLRPLLHPFVTLCRCAVPLCMWEAPQQPCSFRPAATGGSCLKCNSMLLAHPDLLRNLQLRLDLALMAAIAAVRPLQLCFAAQSLMRATCRAAAKRCTV